MALPTGTNFVAGPAYWTLSGSGITAWVSADGLVTAAVTDYTAVHLADGRWVARPGPNALVEVTGTGIAQGDTEWGLYWVGDNAALAANIQHLVSCLSPELDQPAGVDWYNGAFTLGRRKAGGAYESVQGPNASSVDEFVVVTGGHKPGVGFGFGHSTHPDKLDSTTGASYTYASPPVVRVGGRHGGYDTPTADVAGFGYRNTRYTQSDREDITAYHGLTDPRDTHYGESGVGGNQQTLLGGTVTTTVRLLDADTAELLVTRSAGTCPTGGTAVLDGFRDWADAGTREWPADGWRQTVSRADVSGLADGTHRVDVAFRTGDQSYGTAENIPLVMTAGHTPPTVLAFTPLGLGDAPMHVDVTTGRPRHTYAAGKSKVVISPYLFGPDNFQDAQYGLSVRDQMYGRLAVENGIPWEFNYTLSGSSFADYWSDTAALRSLYTTYHSRWQGDGALTTWSGDGWFYDPTASGLGIQACPIRWFHDHGWMQEACEAFVGFMASISRSVGMVYRDEMEYPFGTNPDAPPAAATTAIGLKTDNLNGSAGIESMVTEWRAAGGCMLGPGNVNVNDATPVGFSGWHSDRFSDVINQYHSPGLYPADPFTTGPANYVTMGYAARQRRVNKPFALNVGAIVETSTTSSPGGQPVVTDENYIRGSAYRPEMIGQQIWVALGYGATWLRCYLIESHATKALQDAADTGTYVQRAVHPLDADRWDALLLHAEAAHEYEPWILQPEAEQPAGVSREWFCWAREGNRGDFCCVVNITDAPQRFPVDFPVDRYGAAEVVGLIRSGTAPGDLPGAVIPAGAAVLLLTHDRLNRFSPGNHRNKRDYPMPYPPGSTYSLSTWFFDSDGTATPPDAPPTVTVNRNGSTVSPTLTRLDYDDGRYRVSFTVGADWEDGDTVDVWVSGTADGHQNYDSASFTVDESTLRVISTDPVSVYVNRTVGTMTALYAGEAWGPVFDFDEDMSAGTYEARVSQNNRRRLTVSSPTFSNAGRRMTFSAAGSSTASIPAGVCDVQVVRTDGPSPQVVAHKSMEVRKMIT